jgi:hypothetical protein
VLFRSVASVDSALGLRMVLRQRGTSTFITFARCLRSEPSTSLIRSQICYLCAPIATRCCIWAESAVPLRKSGAFWNVKDAVDDSGGISGTEIPGPDLRISQTRRSLPPQQEPRGWQISLPLGSVRSRYKRRLFGQDFGGRFGHGFVQA